MGFKKNKITPDISTATIYLRGEKKTGKSTLFRDVCLLKGKGADDFGVSLVIGAENGASMLDGIIVPDHRIQTWEDFVEHVDMLVNRKTNNLGLENVRMVSIDTPDQLIPIAERQAVVEANIEAKAVAQAKKDGKFTRVRSILSAFGGFGAGKRHAIDNLIIPQIIRLQESGLGVWLIGHSKVKTVKKNDGAENVEFEKLSSSLENTYESQLSAIADTILTVTTNYNNDDYTEEERSGFNDSTKTVRIAKNFGKLRVYFRDTPLIDAGGRFAEGSVPIYLEFDNHRIDPEKFIETYEEGMRLSRLENRNELLAKLRGEISNSEDTTDNVAVSDAFDDDLKEEIIEDKAYLDKLRSEIGEKWKLEKNSAIKQKVSKYAEKRGGLSNCTEEELLEIKKLLGF